VRRRGVADFERFAAEQQLGVPFGAISRLYEVRHGAGRRGLLTQTNRQRDFEQSRYTGSIKPSPRPDPTPPHPTPPHPTPPHPTPPHPTPPHPTPPHPTPPHPTPQDPDDLSALPEERHRQLARAFIEAAEGEKHLEVYKVGGR
jgi:hypothetical protein